MQDVIATIAGDAVIAIAAMDSVIALPATDVVVFLRTAKVKGQFGDIGFFQHDIVKLEVVTVTVTAGEIVFQRHLVITAVGLDDEIIAFTAEDGVLGIYPGKAQCVGLAVICRVITHGVVTMSLAENVSVAAKITAFKDVVTGTAVKDIATTTTTQSIPTAQSENMFGVTTAGERVVILGTI